MRTKLIAFVGATILLATSFAWSAIEGTTSLEADPDMHLSDSANSVPQIDPDSAQTMGDSDSGDKLRPSRKAFDSIFGFSVDPNLPPEEKIRQLAEYYGKNINTYSLSNNQLATAAEALERYLPFAPDNLQNINLTPSYVGSAGVAWPGTGTIQLEVPEVTSNYTGGVPGGIPWGIGNAGTPLQQTIATLAHEGGHILTMENRDTPWNSFDVNKPMSIYANKSLAENAAEFISLATIYPEKMAGYAASDASIANTYSTIKNWAATKGISLPSRNIAMLTPLYPATLADLLIYWEIKTLI